MAEDPQNPTRDRFDRWTPAWGLALWALVAVIVLPIWLTRGQGFQVAVEITDRDPITVEGFARSEDGPVSTGSVDIRVLDAITARALFVDRVAVSPNGEFKTIAPATPSPPTDEIQAQLPEEPILKVVASYVPTKGADQKSAETSELLGTSTSTAVHALLLLTLVTFGGVLYLTVAPPTGHRIRVLFALSHLAVVSSLLLPAGIGFFATQDTVLAEQMRRAPVGLVEASVDGESTDWLVRIGGQLSTPPPVSEAPTTPEVVAPEPAAEPVDASVVTEPVAEEAAALEEAPTLPTLEGGVAVPLWALVLAAFGAAVAMAREVPSLQRMCPISKLPVARFPTPMTQVVGGLTLGLFGGEPLPPTPAVLTKVATVRRRLMQLYLNIVAAPFLAIAVYYLVQALGGEPPRPTFVVIAFATGFMSDYFIARIKKFVVERVSKQSEGEEVIDEAEITVDASTAVRPSELEGSPTTGRRTGA